MARAAAAKTKTNAKPAPRSSDKDEMLTFHRQMLLIRRFEERAGQLYGMGLIGGFCHLYIGQEAIAVGHAGGETAGRPDHHRLSRTRPHAGLRRRSEDGDGRAHRARARRLEGQGRLDAHVRAEERLLRRPRHRRRAGVARHRAWVLQPLPQEWQGRLRLFRRRRGEPGPGLRELQHGRALAAADRLRDREQPVRHGHQRRALVVGDPPLSAGRELQHPRRRGRRHGRDGCARRGRPRRPSMPVPATAPSSSR